MSAMRVLLVNGDPAESQQISSALAAGQHAVVPTTGLDEAAEVLLEQRFDAVLLGSTLPESELADFAVNLRQIEKLQRATVRTPVLSVASSAAAQSRQKVVDAFLPERPDSAEFAQMFEELANAVANCEGANAPADCPAVFNIQEFRAQVAFDNDLMVEIIDLFMVERAEESVDMADALAKSDIERLSRVAHTLKGSLGSLHADQARFRAQDLETAASDGDMEACARTLAVLEEELNALEPLLLALRESPESD